MLWQLSSAVVLFMSLAVILHDGHQIRAKAIPETRDCLQPIIAATGQATAKSVLQPTNEAPQRTSAARSIDGHITSLIASETSNSEIPTHTTIKTPTTMSVTTESPPPTSPIIYTLVTSNNSHTTPITDTTIGPGSTPYSQQLITSLAPTTGTSSSTVSHTTGKTPGHSSQTTLPKTLSAATLKSTTHQKPTPPTHAQGTPTAIHNATQTASPASTVPGPTLAPQPSSVKIGTYRVLNGSRLCIKAEMGIELIVQEELVFSPPRYFNINPNVTHASGKCGSRKSNLLLSFQGGCVNLTFTKEENSYYISEMGAYLTISNPEKTYQGMKNAVMFETVVGHSFKCVSEQSLQLSSQLQLKTMNVQLQAFDFEGDGFGNVDECSSDYTIVLPVIGAIVVGLCIVGLGVYIIRLRRQPSGYQRI
ncbi:lysosome-associated membrane glycoprotein 3 isoform X2 [Castor canadensis]|uniref:Lysosome-associated membrane glycoprotein 3 isoform X2 n=1 Tax=Castor canadensis TaxID=51338 RepID=A0AC58MK36_CASCN